MTEKTENFVTQEVFETFVKSVSERFAFFDQLNVQTVARNETLLKLMLPEGKAPSYDEFVEGLSKYDTFVKNLREIRAVPKMSERIASALKYNEENPTEFPVMADDVNVLEQASQAESISKSNFDAALKLPHTKLFEESLRKLLGTS